MIRKRVACLDSKLDLLERFVKDKHLVGYPLIIKQLNIIYDRCLDVCLSDIEDKEFLMFFNHNMARLHFILDAFMIVWPEWCETFFSFPDVHFFQHDKWIPLFDALHNRFKSRSFNPSDCDHMKLIGQGSFSKVFMIEHLDIAIKQYKNFDEPFHPLLKTDQYYRMVNNLRFQFQFSKLITDQFLSTVHCYHDHQKGAFLTMPLISEGNFLSFIIHNKTIAMSDAFIKLALNLYSQAILSITHLFNKGGVIPDFKLDNILIDCKEDGSFEAKISDIDDWYDISSGYCPYVYLSRAAAGTYPSPQFYSLYSTMSKRVREKIYRDTSIRIKKSAIEANLVWVAGFNLFSLFETLQKPQLKFHFYNQFAVTNATLPPYDFICSTHSPVFQYSSDFEYILNGIPSVYANYQTLIKSALQKKPSHRPSLSDFCSQLHTTLASFPYISINPVEPPITDLSIELIDPNSNDSTDAHHPSMSDYEQQTQPSILKQFLTCAIS